MKKSTTISNTGLGLLWFGAAISLAEILTGALLAPLGLGLGLAAIVTGHIIGCLILYFTGRIGTQSKLPAMETTKLSFGQKGASFFALLNIAQLIGWTGIMIANGAKALDLIAVTAFDYGNLTLWSILIALLLCLWIITGLRNLTKLNIVTVGSLLVISCLLGSIVFVSGKEGAFSVAGTMSFGAAMELSIIMPLSWLPLVSDYTRYAQRPKSGPLVTAGAYGIGSIFMYAIGLGGALYAGTSDISAILLAAGLPAIALWMVLFSTVTTTFLDVHSAAVSFSLIRPSNEKIVSFIVCGLGLVMAILIPGERYEGFLYLIGTAFAPLFAIVLSDFFLLRRQRGHGPSPFLRNAVLWVVGILLYRIMMQMDTVLGSTVPTMLILMAICFFTEKTGKTLGKKGARHV